MPNNRNIFKIIGIAVVVLLIIVIGSCWYVFFYVGPYHGLIVSSGHTLVFAHRGFGNYDPDNSLVGAQMAMGQGMDGVDMDAQQTSDKEIVIFHDLSVDRLTTS